MDITNPTIVCIPKWANKTFIIHHWHTTITRRDDYDGDDDEEEKEVEKLKKALCKGHLVKILEKFILFEMFEWNWFLRETKRTSVESHWCSNIQYHLIKSHTTLNGLCLSTSTSTCTHKIYYYKSWIYYISKKKKSRSNEIEIVNINKAQFTMVLHVS